MGSPAPVYVQLEEREDSLVDPSASAAVAPIAVCNSDPPFGSVGFSWLGLLGPWVFVGARSSSSVVSSAMAISSRLCGGMRRSFLTILGARHLSVLCPVLPQVTHEELLRQSLASWPFSPQL